MSESAEQPPIAPAPLAEPSVDDAEELLLCSRYGELEKLRELVARIGAAMLASARDDRGNSCLHMAAANDVVTYLLDSLSDEALVAQNEAKNTPIHWAAMNGHIEVLRLICPRVPKSALELRNNANRTPLDEADERGSDASLEAAGYLLGIMDVAEPGDAVDGEAADAAVEDDAAPPADGVESLSLNDGPTKAGTASGEASA